MNYANDNKKRYNASARISAEITKWMRLAFIPTIIPV